MKTKIKLKGVEAGGEGTLTAQGKKARYPTGVRKREGDDRGETPKKARYLNMPTTASVVTNVPTWFRRQ